jgi:prefoldin subunit 5
MANKDYLNYKLNNLKKEVPTLKRKVDKVQASVAALDTELDTLLAKFDTLGAAVESYYTTTQNHYERQLRKLNKHIAALEKKLAQGGVTDSGVNPVILDKAKTIAIFDAIINAITEWSQAGDLASDVEAAIQSALFPSVYERVMSGEDPAYLLSDVPDSAKIVVERGRKYVQWVRSVCDTHLTNPEAWEKHAHEVQKWWVTDALPLIYGESDPEWEDDVPYTLDQMETWKNQPADRMMAFPRIHDAMDLFSKNRKEIYEQTSILQFTKETAATRLP